MKYLLLFLPLTLGALPPAWAQTVTHGLSSQRAEVEMNVMPVVQWYSNEGQTLRESTVPVYVFIPVGRQFAVSMRAGAAAVGGRDLTSVRGITDVQTSVSYTRSLGEGSAVVTAGVNLPSGKHRLSNDESDTSVLLSRNFYDFRVSSFGQGFNVSSGITWARPITDNFVVGGGGSYLYKGGYQPFRHITQDYHPGNEILLTGGVDYRVTRTSSLAADITHMWYAEDRWGSRRYRSGATTIGAIQFLKYMQFNELRLIMRYRHRAKSDVRLQLEQQRAPQQLVANQGELVASYRMRLDEAITVTSKVQVRVYGNTVGNSRKYLGDLGVLPRLEVSERWDLVARVIGTLGSFAGVEAGIGVSMQL